MNDVTEVDCQLSPSLTAQAEGAKAYEVKFLVSEAQALAIEDWAARQLERDPHCQSEEGGCYQITSLYTDTAGLDVYHRSPKYRRRKYRLRRYGAESIIHLERKIRRGSEVSKRRSSVPDSELRLLDDPFGITEWPGHWFHQSLLRKGLRPACQIDYLRTAYFRGDQKEPLRLTLDRQIRGELASDWIVGVSDRALALLPDQVVLELKFRDSMPGEFKQLVADMQLEATGFSKYRRCLDARRETATEEPGVQYA